MRSLRLRTPSRHEVLRRVRPRARGRRPRRGLAAAAGDGDVLRHGRVDQPRRLARPRGLPRDPGRLPADVRGGRPALRRLQRAVGGRRAARLLRLPAGARGPGAARGPRRAADRGGDRALQRAARRAVAGAGRLAQRARGRRARSGRAGRGWSARSSATTPHIAARLQSLAAPGTVVVSDAVRELVDRHFVLEPLGEHALRGVARPVEVHRALRATGVVGRLDVVGPRALKPMVGRDAELAQLEIAWGRAAGGRGAIVHIPGEAGIGKSRLVRALTEKVGGAHVWQCSSHHRSTSLYPVIQYLERRLGLERSEPPERQVAASTRSVLDAGLDPGATVPLLAELLGVDAGERTDLAPIDARTATLRAIEALLAADAARRPAAARRRGPALGRPDDGRAARPPGDRAARATGSCASRTYRREFEPPWAADRTIALGPLTNGRRARDGRGERPRHRPVGRRRRPAVHRGAAEDARAPRTRANATAGLHGHAGPADAPGPAHPAARAAAGVQRRDRRRRGARPRVRGGADRGAGPARRRDRASWSSTR